MIRAHTSGDAATVTPHADTSKPLRRRLSVPAYLTIVVVVLVVGALPLVARLVDDSADEFSRHSIPVGPTIGWIVCALLAAIAVNRRLQLQLHVEEGALTALAYDAMPLLLISAWVVMFAALLSGHWLLAVVAGGLCAYHLILVVPRLFRVDAPSWVRRADRFRLGVANVFIDNETPDDAARQIVESEADVTVVVEATPAFLATFDEVGGADAFPHRVCDPDDDSDYAIAIVSRRELGERSLMTRVGSLRVAIADVEVGGIPTLVVAVNPMATVDPGGHVEWKEQIEVLTAFVPTLDGPLVLAGDLNSTRYRPEFQALLDLGLMDAIDALGEAWRPSFKLGAEGTLGAVGPVVRLDHALVNGGLWPVSMENLEPAGSDHVPFVIELAVDPRSGGERGQRRLDRSGRRRVRHTARHARFAGAGPVDAPVADSPPTTE